MTDSALQILSDFRAEVAEPGEETASRIYALAIDPARQKRCETERRRHMRRSRLVLALAVAALLAVPTAVAFGGKLVDLFQGTPAPAEISTNFTGFNRSADRLADFATRQGFAMTLPHADVSKAHGVIEIQTPDGPQDLWAAPSDQGANCYFIDFADDQPSPTGEKLGIGGCDPSAAPVSNINWGQVWFRPHPDLVTVWGSVFVDAATVRLVLADGSTLSLPIVERLFLGSLAKGDKVVKVTAFDAAGNEVAEWAKPQ
jgi:hypothetical protein